MNHPYYVSPKQEQKRDIVEETKTFFTTLTRQSESLKGKRILEVTSNATA